MDTWHDVLVRELRQLVRDALDMHSRSRLSQTCRRAHAEDPISFADVLPSVMDQENRALLCLIHKTWLRNGHDVLFMTLCYRWLRGMSCVGALDRLRTQTLCPPTITMRIELSFVTPPFMALVLVDETETEHWLTLGDTGTYSWSYSNKKQRSSIAARTCEQAFQAMGIGTARRLFQPGFLVRK